MTAFFHRLIRLQEQCAVLSRCKLRTFYSFQPTGHWAFAESINRVAATATGVFEEKKGKKTQTGAQFIISVYVTLPAESLGWYTRAPSTETAYLVTGLPLHLPLMFLPFISFLVTGMLLASRWNHVLFFLVSDLCFCLLRCLLHLDGQGQ